MIDLHGRYLPWVGDGPDSLDEALTLLRMAEADGVRLVVLTPTVDPGRSRVVRADLEKKFAAFAQLARRRGIRVRLRLGAELIHGAGAIEAIDRHEVPLVGEWEGRRVVLLRWLEDFIPIGAISATQDMIARGVLPMLAHPERNPGVVRAPLTLELFRCDGCLVQVDAGSVLGWHGPDVRQTAFRLIEAGVATVLASGAATAGRHPPSLRAARDIVAQRFGDDIAIRLTELNPSLIVAEDLARGREDRAASNVAAGDPAPVAAFAAKTAGPIESPPVGVGAPVLPATLAAGPFPAFGIRGEARGQPPGCKRRAAASDAGPDRAPRGRRDAGRAGEPVIEPAAPRLPLMPF